MSPFSFLKKVILSALILTVIGVVAAALLYIFARRFHVEADPRIDEVESLLPGANCGGCGFSGCRAFAQACCKAASLNGLSCPGSDATVMEKIAGILGQRVAGADDRRNVAVVGCGAACYVRQNIARYDGPASCAALASIGSGPTLCSYGCLGLADCVRACPFGAIVMNSSTRLPEVDYSRCTGCGACSAQCPRSVISIRPAIKSAAFSYVACSNSLGGAMALKACRSACIACGKCERLCPESAITLHLPEGSRIAVPPARIDATRCTACGICIEACPTHAILAANA